MPRTARHLADKGFYHVVTRGIDRRKLFRSHRDYNYLLEVLEKYSVKFQVAIVHYCLMSNHLHLLIFSERAGDLPRFMQGVLQTYAAYFRKKFGSVGFVFQNRYKSRFINKDSYLLECGRYIERNPLRAKITDNPLNYPWSSYSYYAEGKPNSLIKLINPLFLGLAEIEKERQRVYSKYVLEERLYEHIVDKEFKLS
jgi:putative transposase